jgi:hypothetical protein
MIKKLREFASVLHTQRGFDQKQTDAVFSLRVIFKKDFRFRK